jgi:hypothetical protein
MRRRYLVLGLFLLVLGTGALSIALLAARSDVEHGGLMVYQLLVQSAILFTLGSVILLVERRNARRTLERRPDGIPTNRAVGNQVAKPAPAGAR